MELVVYGTVQSASLLLMSFGFGLTYGISRLPNFAHGAVYVFSGYAAWFFLHRCSLPFGLAALAAIVCSALLGVLLYVLVLKRIRGMEMSEVIATYAVGLVLLEGLRELGLRGSTHALPRLVDTQIEVLGVPLDGQRALVVVLAAVVVALLWAFTRFTRLGRALRGVAQDERAAMLLGIDSDRTAAVSVALGSALAAVGALLLFPLGNIVVQEGHKVLIYALAVCVVGGLGSWRGMIVASILLGFSQYAVDFAASESSHYQMVVMLVAIVGTLVLRPSGLFGRQKALEERV